MGLGAILGGLASGYVGAAQQDQQRKFQDEQNRRASMSDLFGKLMSDETADPALRAWALQQRLGVAQAPYKEGKPFQPDFSGFPATRPGQPAQGVKTPPVGAGPPAPPAGLTGSIPPTAIPQAAAQAMPAGVAGPPAPSAQAPNVSFAPPPLPPTLASLPGQSVNLAAQPPQPVQPFMSPAEHTAMLAQRTGAVTGAQAGGELEGKMAVLGPAVDKIMRENPQYANDPIIGPAFQMMGLGMQPGYGLYRAGMAGPQVEMTAQQAMSDPTVAALFQQKFPNAKPTDTFKVIRSTGGQIQDIQPVTIPGLVTKETSSTTQQAGGLPTTKKQTVTPQLGGPPAPPTGSTATQGAGNKKPSGNASTPAAMNPAVSGALQQIGLYGIPEGKLSNADNLALSWMKQHGIDPSVAASPQGRSRADAARAMQPLLIQAMSDIQSNPQLAAELGPLAGRWSEIEKRVGDMTPEARHLAGTLKSIYSFAVTMHGWRSSTAPKEFEATYGGLSADPDSLLSGLNAMQDTANAVTKIGYPGLTSGGPPPPPAGTPKPFDIKQFPKIQ